MFLSYYMKNWGNDMHDNLIKLAVSMKQLQNLSDIKEKEGTLRYNTTAPMLVRESFDKQGLNRNQRKRVLNIMSENLLQTVPTEEVLNKRKAVEVLKEGTRPGLGSQSFMSKKQLKILPEHVQDQMKLTLEMGQKPNSYKNTRYLYKNPKMANTVNKTVEDLFTRDKAVALVNPEADIKSLLFKHNLRSNTNITPNDLSQKDKDALKLITAHHELSEVNPKHNKHGSRFASVSPGHSHIALQNVRDMNVVNTMNEAPEAQKIMRNFRQAELGEMTRKGTDFVSATVAPSQGISKLTEGIRGGQQGFENRIKQNAERLMSEHKEHNQKVLSRVPERLHSHPAVQQRLKPTDQNVIDQMAETTTRKAGRLNRHQIKTLGKLLDKHVSEPMIADKIEEISGYRAGSDLMRQDAVKSMGKYIKRISRKGRVR